MITKSMKLFIITAALLLSCGKIFSQEDQIPVRDDQAAKPQQRTVVNHKMDLGFGLGLDYGGILGVQLGFAPVKHITLFGAVGYYMLQAGWNVGVKFLFLPKTTKHTVRPFLKAMYGCNSIITAEGASEYDKVYNGFTVGLGLELRFGKKKQNGFDFDLNAPLRTSDFWDDYDRMKNDPRMDVLVGPIPVAFSIGYHHEF